MSKRNDAIEIMKANAETSMVEVVAMIAAKINVTEANAKSYYKWIVANGKAPGEVIKTTRAKTVKATTTKTKMVKVPKPKVQGDKPKITDKTVEEINDIRAKNLARLKSVGKKYAKGQYAEPTATGVPDFDADEARAYVDSVTNDLDSFKSPSSLTADEVKALV